MYWFGTSVMLNHIMQHCWPHVLSSTMPESLPTCVSDEAFCSAVAFVHRRFAYGHAVLSVSAQEAAWLAPEAAARKERSDLTPTVLRLLRSNPGSCVRFHHVLQAELGLKRMWERGGPAERQLVQQHVQRIWLALKDLGVGTLRGEGSEMHLHKLSRAALPAPTVAWLRRVRVPLLLFGPCEQGREMDLPALHVPGLFPEERTTPLPSTENKESSSNAAAAVSDDVKVELTRGQRGAQTRACRNAERPEFVSCSDLGAGILPQSSLVSVLHKRPEWQDYKHKIRVVWKNDTRVAVNVTLCGGSWLFFPVALHILLANCRLLSRHVADY